MRLYIHTYIYNTVYHVVYNTVCLLYVKHCVCSYVVVYSAVLHIFLGLFLRLPEPPSELSQGPVCLGLKTSPLLAGPSHFPCRREHGRA